MQQLIRKTTLEMDQRRKLIKGFGGDLNNEVLIGPNELLSVAFLEAAVEKAKTVSFIKLPNGGASGFLISNDLLLTNNHVFPDSKTADEAEINFNFDNDIHGNAKPYSVYFCNPNDFFYTNEQLDYSVVKVNRIIQNGSFQRSIPGNAQGFTPLSPKLSVNVTDNLNIIQHPGMRRKEIAIRNNFFQKINPNDHNFILYTTDTEPGASGSPIYNDNWELVGLHHAAGQSINGKFVNNEGISIFSIINDMIKTFPTMPNGVEILQELGIKGLREIEIDSALYPLGESGSVSVSGDNRGNTSGTVTGTWGPVTGSITADSRGNASGTVTGTWRF
ncbi:trypsin-like serine peptidase [Paenibacillus sp. SEL3]